MKKLVVLVGGPLIVGSVGGTSWVYFMKHMAPHLPQDEMAFVGLVGGLAVFCLSALGAAATGAWYHYLKK